MKKIIAVVLVVVLMVSVSATAFAAWNTNWAFGYYGQCVNSTTLNHADASHPKVTTDNFIEVRHSVTGSGSGAGFTNLMYAYKYGDGKYVGDKWQAPNGIYYACTSSTLTNYRANVTPGGRGNTKYNEQLGLTSVLMEGQYRTH